MTGPNPANGLAYRPEIDGLRALAVLPVILFHAGLPVFSGGFVGVDVFFVISGYLITGILLADIEADRFSLVAFYERRARRLLPALFVVMAVTLALAWVSLLPADMIDFGESLAAVATFCSNVLFWQESDYFASDASLKPLLHTWSLAVEEQYYLLFPLLLLALTRFGRRRLPWLLGLLLLGSLAVAAWGAVNKPVPSFYLLPARGWELLIGGLLAVWQSRSPRPLAPVVEAGLALSGFAAILYAIFRFDESTPVPGLPMLIPTLGTAAVIVGTRSASPIRTLLCAPPVVMLGLISYSAYLWHQPLIALAHYRWPVVRPDWLIPALLLSTLLFAWLTWKFVEQPWRNRQRFSRRQVFAGAMAGLVLFLATGFAIQQAEGIPGRLPDHVLAFGNEALRHEKLRDDGGCSQNRDQTVPAACVRGAATNPDLALIGDSHAASLAPALEAMLHEQGRSFVQYTKLGCPFGLDVAISEDLGCATFWKNVFDDLDRRDIHTLVIAIRWTYYLHDRGFDNGLGGIEYHDGKRYSAGSIPFDAPREVREQALLDAYRDALLRLDRDDRDLFVVLPLPEQGWDVPRLLARAAADHPPGRIPTDAIPPLPRSLWLTRHAAVLDAFSEFASHPRIHLFDPTPALCPLDHGNACPAVIEDTVLYYDDDHPSISGARRVLDPLMARMYPVESRPIAAHAR